MTWSFFPEFVTVTIVIVNKTCSYFCPEFVTVTIVVVNKTCSFCPEFVTVTIVIINNRKHVIKWSLFIVNTQEFICFM